MIKSRKNLLQATVCWRVIGVWGTMEEKCPELKKFTHCRNCPVFSKAGHSVFEKSAPSGYLTQWRKEISAQKNNDKTTPHSVLVFRVGNEWFGIHAHVLSEVADVREIHRIPRNINHFITGIVNIHGEIKVCYSLRDLLSLRVDNDVDCDRAKHNPKRLIVVEFSDLQYVFLVDEVKGLHWYNDTEILPVPSTLNSESSLLLLGSISQFNSQVAIFNLSKFQEKLEGAAS